MKKQILILALLSAIIINSAKAQTTIASGTCGAGLTWVLTSDSVLTISGNGEMNGDCPWYNYRTQFSQVIIEDAVTYIASKAFYEYNNITSVTIGKSVERINVSFAGCANLKTLNFNAINCESVMGFLKSSPSSSFIGCTSLCNVNIGSEVTQIPDNIFAGCSGLTSIVIPNNVTSIGESIFSYCTSLTEMTLPFIGASATATGSSAVLSYFGSEIRDNIEKITITSPCSKIGNNALSGCSKLKEITIPSSVTILGNYALSGCTSLEHIYAQKDMPPTANSTTFEYVNKFTCKLHVPVGSKQYYSHESAEGWKEFAFIEEEISTDISTMSICPVSIYPNPSSGIVYIQRESETIPEVKIYTMDGRLLQTVRSVEIDISSYTAGVYFLQIDGQMTKLIKN